MRAITSPCGRITSHSSACARTAVKHDTHHLRDGTAVTVRPISTSDDERLVRFHESLSAESTRMRFFSVHPHLSSHETVRFTDVDHYDREAWVALVGDDIIGVGRYERLANPQDAEIAFVVADRW